MTTAQAKILIESDPDFVYSKRDNYSLSEMLKRYKEGCPDRVIAAVLLITEDDVQARYDAIVAKLRKAMGIEDPL
jgi:hypothetical protein